MADYHWYLLVLVSIVSNFINSCDGACEGYVIKDLKIKPCSGSNELIKVTDYDVELTPDCKIIPKGCLELTKDIEKFSVEYEVSKNGAVLRQNKIKNGCNRLENIDKEFQSIFDKFNFVNKCPLKAGKICNEKGKSINIEKHAMALPAILGKMKGKFTMKTNAGDACFEFEQNLIFNVDQAGKDLVGRLPKLGK